MFIGPLCAMAPFEAPVILSRLILDLAGETSVQSEAGNSAQLISDILRAAPPPIRAMATVMDGEGNILRAGSGQYTCMPAADVFPGPVCMDQVWLDWLQAHREKETFTTGKNGVAFVFAERGSKVSPHPHRSMQIENRRRLEGPYIMVISPDPSDLDTIPIISEEDDPFLVWPESPFAHIMAPIGNKTQVAE